jgi:hypothetical protein
VPDTGSLRGDVLATLRLMAAFLRADEGAILCRAVGALRGAPLVADAVRRELIDARRGIARTIVARAVQRGDLPPGVDPDVFEAVAPPLVFFRLNVLAEPVDEEFLAHVTDEVLLPLMSRTGGTTDESGAPAPSSLPDPSASTTTGSDQPAPGRPDPERPLPRADHKEPA